MSGSEKIIDTLGVSSHESGEVNTSSPRATNVDSNDLSNFRNSYSYSSDSGSLYSNSSSSDSSSFARVASQRST